MTCLICIITQYPVQYDGRVKRDVEKEGKHGRDALQKGVPRQAA